MLCFSASEWWRGRSGAFWQLGQGGYRSLWHIFRICAAHCNKTHSPPCGASHVGQEPGVSSPQWRGEQLGTSTARPLGILTREHQLGLLDAGHIRVYKALSVIFTSGCAGRDGIDQDTSHPKWVCWVMLLKHFCLSQEAQRDFLNTVVMGALGWLSR